jgi:hypothetical protein
MRRASATRLSCELRSYPRLVKYKLDVQRNNSEHWNILYIKLDTAAGALIGLHNRRVRFSTQAEELFPHLPQYYRNTPGRSKTALRRNHTHVHTSWTSLRVEYLLYCQFWSGVDSSRVCEYEDPFLRER